MYKIAEGEEDEKEEEEEEKYTEAIITSPYLLPLFSFDSFRMANFQSHSNLDKKETKQKSKRKTTETQ